ncbi:hypothetical protein B0O99DRAFT_514662 [Bisporella sp. PMI_857]|nr:hypothetical protein B0O99DRAFT_514662 [Bisporella sp. PMI_857]
MEGQPPTPNSQYQYQSAQWSRLLRRNTLGESPSNLSPSIATAHPTHVDLVPILLPQQSSYHQAQLVQYNKLITSGRTSRLQTPPLPPLLSAQTIQAVPGSRSGSSGGNTARNNKSSGRGGHGNKESRKSSKGERALITDKASSSTMPSKKFQLSQMQQQLPSRPSPQHQNSNISHQSSSVPSTPHQHARKFSFESREPSPNATGSHSPRSAYSESNVILPSQRPVGGRGGCRYETFTQFQKRRMPYSLGAEKLVKLDDKDVKSKLTEDEDRQLTTDMRELYDRLKPTSEGDLKRKMLVEKLEKLFNTEWPGHDIRVRVFGSSGNLLCTDESDVDICITTDWKVLEGVCMIAELLAKSGMKEVICVPGAKVPIVKVFDPVLKLACDMNVNNTLALENTRMIKTYVEIDPRVRPLAMIIKYWTKRRIVNDAAFGATLSSYTWICMIINFLQSRKPPVLPSLHQRPHMKLPSKDGKESPFADDLHALRGFGKKNTESLGQLLFAFFRFYGHEFDYDNLVVSVRNGKQILKTEKKWQFGNNNHLCVEEPFNTLRNLGNTADETSFRGLHMELRRAFDLISGGKLEECCEQYEFPPEEKPQPFVRPATTSKPVTINISRSVSQSQSRGGGRSSRGGRNSSSRNSNRRASAGTFDNQPGYIPGASNLTPQELWQQQQAQAQLHNDLYQTFSFLQTQEQSLRLQLYSQSQAYMTQSHGQNSIYSQPQPRSTGNGPIHQQATDRNRTNSFDQAPLTAPLRPDFYYYPLAYQPVYNGFQTPSTNPSSPSMSSAVPDLRRSVHRTSVTNGSSGPSNSSMRSHSQPATRSSPLSLQGGVQNAGLGILYSRQQNGPPIPNFQMADENSDPSYGPVSARNSPPEDITPRKYVGYYVNDGGQGTPRRDSAALAIPAFGDIQSHGRRRLSTDQLPPSVLNHMNQMKTRPSRSPSPLGNDGTFPSGPHSAPLVAGTSQHGISNNNLQALNNQIPPVVNGSSIPTPISIQNWQAAISGGSEDASIDTESSQSFGTASTPSTENDLVGQITPRDVRSEQHSEPPMVVNGSVPAQTDPFPVLSSPPVVNGASQYGNNSDGSTLSDLFNGSLRLSPNSRNRLIRQNGGMSPLDIGSSMNEGREDLPHLSPVYEIATPSPTANRKFDSGLDRKSGTATVITKDEKSGTLKSNSKLAPTNGNQVKQAIAEQKINGHIRASKSEGGGTGSWQQISTKNKKKGVSSEKPPRLESERKGG